MTREEVETLGQEFSKAFGNQDIDDIAAFYTDDARILPPGAPLGEGKAAVAQVFQQLFAVGARTVEFKTLDILEGDDLIVEVGRFGLGLESPGADPTRAPGKYVVVYRRQPDGALKLAVDVFNLDAPS